MENKFLNLSNSQTWHVLVEAAKRAAKKEGYDLVRIPGRGRSNMHYANKGGQMQLVSIRTTRDRWIAYQPVNGKWKTLDDATVVIVAAVDDPEDPKKAEIYILPSAEVKDRFDAAYKARTESGQKVRDNFGMWVSLDCDDRGIAASVGSGIVESLTPVAVYPLADFDVADENDSKIEKEGDVRPPTIAEVLDVARRQIAKIAGVAPDHIKIDLKIEH